MFLKPRTAPIFRFIFFVFLSLFLIIYDQKRHQTEELRAGLATVVAPIQLGVSWPFDLVSWLQDSFTSHQTLLQQNADLKAEWLLQQAQIQKMLALEKENNQLRALLKSSAYLTGKVKVAQVLAIDLDPYLAEAVLDVGKKQGVFEGQPVLDAYGVMGQIIQVAPFTSRLMFITDTRSAVPVEDERTGVNAIAIGTGPQRLLSLINVPETADIRVGDKLITSGLDLRYPVGYPLGIVKSVNFHSGELFSTIAVSPAARVNESRQVLLLFLPARQVYTEAREMLRQIQSEKADHPILPFSGLP